MKVKIILLVVLVISCNQEDAKQTSNDKALEMSDMPIELNARLEKLEKQIFILNNSPQYKENDSVCYQGEKCLILGFQGIGSYITANSRQYVNKYYVRTKYQNVIIVDEEDLDDCDTWVFMKYDCDSRIYFNLE